MTDDAQARIADIVAKSDVLLFMKGSPLFPQCGFSSRAVAILNHLNADFEEAGDEDVIRKLVSDLTAASVEIDESVVRTAIDDKTVEARRQLLQSE